MAIISIYIPDNETERVFDAISDHYGYQSIIRNPVGGQYDVLWSSGYQYNYELLPIASGYGHIGPLPGHKEERIFYSNNEYELISFAKQEGYNGSGIPDPITLPFVTGINGTGVQYNYFYPVTFPFVGSYQSGEMLGVATGVYPELIQNPQSKSEFTNVIIRNFLTEHVRSYELELARKQAEQSASNAGNISVNDGLTTPIYGYYMVCLEPAKQQYDILASIISSGSNFNIPLSQDGQNPPTHYGLDIGITETARQQLLVLEFAGGTTTGGIQTLFYIRYNLKTKIAEATNIDGFNIAGRDCSFADLINYLNLQIIN